MKRSIIQMVLMFAILSRWNVFAASDSSDSLPPLIVQREGICAAMMINGVVIYKQIEVSLRFLCGARLAAVVIEGQSGYDFSKSDVRTQVISQMLLELPDNRQIEFGVARFEQKDASGKWGWLVKILSANKYPSVESKIKRFLGDLDLALVTTKFFGGYLGEKKTKIIKVPLNKTQEESSPALDLTISAGTDALKVLHIEETPDQLSGDFLNETIRKIDSELSEMLKKGSSGSATP